MIVPKPDKTPKEPAGQKPTDDKDKTAKPEGTQPGAPPATPAAGTAGPPLDPKAQAETEAQAVKLRDAAKAETEAAAALQATAIAPLAPGEMRIVVRVTPDKGLGVLWQGFRTPEEILGFIRLRMNPELLEKVALNAFQKSAQQARPGGG